MKYRVIMADPPWGGDGEFGPKISDHYPLMKLADICALPIASLSDDDAVLIMWSTWTHLEAALTVIKTWGFNYTAGFPWIKVEDPPAIDLFGDFRSKPTWGLGAWVRGCSEPILIAKRGNARPPEGHFLGLIAPRMQHSRKPDDIYDYAEAFPGPYLELFARRVRPGWDVWGNEVTPSVPLSGLTRACT